MFTKKLGQLLEGRFLRKADIAGDPATGKKGFISAIEGYADSYINDPDTLPEISDLVNRHINNIIRVIRYYNFLTPEGIKDISNLEAYRSVINEDGQLGYELREMRKDFDKVLKDNMYLQFLADEDLVTFKITTNKKGDLKPQIIGTELEDILNDNILLSSKFKKSWGKVLDENLDTTVEHGLKCLKLRHLQAHVNKEIMNIYEIKIKEREAEEEKSKASKRER